MMDLDWQQQAACRGLNWMTDYKRTEEAREVCLSCPVSAPCLEYAYSDHARGIPGVLAGLTADERGQVTCTNCGAVDWKKHTRKGLCWQCYLDAREAAVA